MTGAAAWRLVRAIDSPGSALPEPLAGALNMAVDQALFESVQAGAPAVLRLYRWAPPCLSLGRNQRAAGFYERGRGAGARHPHRTAVPGAASACSHANHLN